MFTFGEETGADQFHFWLCVFGRRPNTSDPTLTNALVRAKVTSRRRGHRHAIRGIVHSDDASRSPSSTLPVCTGRALCWASGSTTSRNRTRRSTRHRAMPTRRSVGDRWIVEQPRSTGPANTTLVVIVTKIDKVPKESGRPAGSGSANSSQIRPRLSVSAMTGDR